MPDEAVVRIVLSDGGGGGGGNAPQPPTPTSNTPAPTPTPTPLPPPPPSRDWINDLVQGIAGANRHVLIEGQSGSGKSLLTRHVAFQRMQRGEEVSVVDTHNPEMWGGAKQVFQGSNQEAAEGARRYLNELLTSRKQESQEAKLRGEVPDFKPVTVVFSDFARLIKDSPALQKELQTTLTEARKFNIAILADTTAMTGAATGIKGITDVLNNFSQKVALSAPTATTPYRTAEVEGETFKTPTLSEYKENVDYSLVRPPTPPKPEVDPDVQERKEAESRARLLATVSRLDREAARQKEADAAKDAAEQAQRDQTAAASHARLVAKIMQMDREAAAEKKRLEEADPYYQATKRREAEQNAARVRAAYKDKYGDDSGKDALGKIIDTANQFRGMIGGLGGSVVGGILDVAAAARKAQVERSSKDKDRQLLSETGATTGSGKVATATGNAVVGAATKAATGATAAEAGAAAETVGTMAAVSGVVSAVLGSPEFAALAATVFVLAESASALSNAADKYAEYNPEIAQAKAMAEIGSIMGDMRRADQYSKQLVEFTAAQFEMQQKWEDVKLKFIAAVEPMVSTIMVATGKVADFLGVIIDLIEWFAEKMHLKTAEKVPDPADDLFLFEGSPGAERAVPGVGI